MSARGPGIILGTSALVIAAIVIGAALGYATIGAIVALTIALTVLGELVRSRQRVTAWRVGAEGEHATARALASLPPGWVVLHDRRIPGGRANIDHVVVGPQGVFVIETKSWTGRVSIDGDAIWLNGRRQDVVDQVRREAEAVRQVWNDVNRPITVRPVICIHRAELPLFHHRVGGIPLVSSRRLVDVVESPPIFGPEEVTTLAETLDRGLRPA